MDCDADAAHSQIPAVHNTAATTRHITAVRLSEIIRSLLDSFMLKYEHFYWRSSQNFTVKHKCVFLAAIRMQLDSLWLTFSQAKNCFISLISKQNRRLSIKRCNPPFLYFLGLQLKIIIYYRLICKLFSGLINE